MYENFMKIDGSHPWRGVDPEGYIDYPVRFRGGGRVLYFNFPLAKELELIPLNHPNEMNLTLEDAVIKTFSLQILNEHDWENKKSFPKDGYEDRLYMATRYLQLQHNNKQGETSGDGRSIWNGFLVTKDRIYDISSRGTGATRLSPGAQEAKTAVVTGDDSLGYSSGLADLDEMLSSALMSEIFYREGIPTERCLTVIDYADKSSIGVRVASNLIRPAHIFRYLKQSMWQETKDSFDYFLKRQIHNKEMRLPKEEKERYPDALEHLAKTYAKLAAIMEEEYIFNWLSWDGDNMLASGGILDYGSIRRFAAKHNKYRYEDTDRFSTCLSEQKFWARNMIQQFVQIVDFILTKERKNFKEFEDDKMIKLFDSTFLEERERQLLWRTGFDNEQIDVLVKGHKADIEKFRRILYYFEELKVAEGEQKVPDGIDHPPVFLVRNILRELPLFLLKGKQNGAWVFMPVEEFCAIMAASYVDKEDLKLTDTRKLRAIEFQESYRDLIKALGKEENETIKSLVKRSQVINYEHRCTGDGLIWITNEALKFRETIDRNQFQEAMDRFIESQVLIPGAWKPINEDELKGTSIKSRLLKKMQENLEIYSEKI